MALIKSLEGAFVLTANKIRSKINKKRTFISNTKTPNFWDCAGFQK